MYIKAVYTEVGSQAFRAVDEDKSGLISKHEFARIFKILNIPCGTKEVVLPHPTESLQPFSFSPRTTATSLSCDMISVRFLS